jgi:PQQ-dependent catabolism-associated CXXCW motif protein
MSVSRAAAIGLCLLLPIFAAPAQTPEPAEYWTGEVNSPVTATIRGGKVIHVQELAALLKGGRAVVVDVSNAPRRPENMAPGAPWLPLPHQAIPGSIWIPGAGLGEIPPAVDTFFRQRLAAETGEDLSHPIVIYCHERCWLSWNAAKRAISYGYTDVCWLPDGVEGWHAAGLSTSAIEPEAVP